MDYSANEIKKALHITWELAGADLSDDAAKVMMLQLKPYGGDAVMQALNRLQREKKGRPSLADIIERIEAKDGRPTAAEAWAMIGNSLRDERETIVLTEEMQLACGPAREALELGDKFTASRAFSDAYSRLVDDARAQGKPIRWMVSRGTDQQLAADSIKRAYDEGKLSKEYALIALPGIADEHRHEIETGAPLTLEQKKQAKENTARILSLLEFKK